MPEPPPTQTKTGVQSALDLADELGRVAIHLKRELRSYDTPESVGRDTAVLRTYFMRVHELESQLAQKMGIEWNTAGGINSS